METRYKRRASISSIVSQSPFDDKNVEYDPFETHLTDPTTARERALSQDDYQRLLEGASRLDDYYQLQSEFVIVLAGRLGMRSGEICHLQSSWVDMDNKTIHIPLHDACDSGKGGGICGSCLQLAQQMADRNDAPVTEMEDLFWKAKTAEAERDIPYDFDPKCESVIEEYINRFGRYTESKSGISRAVNRALAEADGLEKGDTMPHGLRATAASFHASHGLNVWGLQHIMGWAYPQTAQNYVVKSQHNVKQALRKIHKD